jgi:hypothetical protein
MNTPPLLRRYDVLMLAVFAVCSTGVDVAQDFFYALRNHSAFYLSESLLFKVFWLGFVPVPLAVLWLLRSAVVRHRVETVAAHISLFMVCAITLHAVLFAGLVYVLSALLFDHRYTFWHNLSYTLANDSLMYLLVYAAIGWMGIHGRRVLQPHAPIAHQEVHHLAQPTPPRHIAIGTTKRRVAVPVEDIICITTAAPYLSVQTQDKEYLHAETLKSLHKLLPSQQFVRVHKSAIVNIQKVVSFTSRLNGDYDVLLANKHTVRLSRNYAKVFKEHFECLVLPQHTTS